MLALGVPLLADVVRDREPDHGFASAYMASGT